MPKANLPVIDAHIHLYAASHLQALNWTSTLPTDHVLNRQRSIEDFKSAISRHSAVLGFIFVETDRKSTNHSSGWADPLEELAFLARIARGEPCQDEGHEPVDKKMLLGIVPWAPVAAGPRALEEYVSRAKRFCLDEKTFTLVKGFRYLVQDKPPKTMIQPDFLEGLRWLGHHGFTFDLGIDARSGGMWQMQEACEMFRQLSVSGNMPVIVINHFCKPDLRVNANAEDPKKSFEFAQWKSHIQSMGSYPNTFMKLSGFFSELPTQHKDCATPIPKLVERVMPWIDVVFDTFSSSRIMFGSDWPVCTANGPGDESWQHWMDLVEAILDARNMTNEDKSNVLSGTAIRAYSIQTPSQ